MCMFMGLCWFFRLLCIVWVKNSPVTFGDYRASTTKLHIDCSTVDGQAHDACVLQFLNLKAYLLYGTKT